METPDSSRPNHSPPANIHPADRVHVAEVVDNDSGPVPTTPTRRGLSLGGLFAWVAIVLIAVGMFFVTAVSQKMMEAEAGTEASVADLMPIQMQGKVLVAQQQLSMPPENRSVNKQGAKEQEAIEKPASMLTPELDVGPYEQRLSYSILVSELESVDAAIEHLEVTDQRVETAGIELTEQQRQLRETIGELFAAYAQGKGPENISNTQRTTLQKKLGWIGELALVPAGLADSERRQAVLREATGGMILMGVLAVFGIGLLLVAFVVSMVMIFLFARGSLNSGLSETPTDHNLYAETFAIWMAIFFGGQLVLPMLMMVVGLGDRELMTAMVPLIFFGSLGALAWPIFRGVSPAQLLHDIGWRFGNPLKESVLGLASYLTVIPALMVGLITLTVYLTFTQPTPSPELFSTPGGPGHPMQDLVGENSGFMIAILVIVACVAAPIVEETMFRGVFYRHLRDWMPIGSHRYAGVAFACIVNSFVFAAIHPQGLLGIPVLGILAIGFSLVREWRDSLMGPIVMHAINNGIITLILFSMM